MPFPLPGRISIREIAARSYEQHLAVWEEMDRLGYDGVGLNEHHTTPHGLMNSPNMMAAAGAQRTKKLKFFILGNLLPLHNPLRIAEELAMADCISRGRIMAGFARGVPREYKVYDVPMAESRARFDEALDGDPARPGQENTFTPRGQVLEVQGHRDLAAALSAAASAGVDSVHRLEGDDRVRGGGQFRRRDPSSASRRGAGHDRVFRQEARRKRPPHPAGPDLHDDRGLGRRERRQGGRRIRAVLPLFQQRALASRRQSAGAEGQPGRERLCGVVVLRLRAAGERRARR